MYEFAGRIVGKCLFESALGGAYKQLVRARFTRSFLAQIIGLRMNYKVGKRNSGYVFIVCVLLSAALSHHFNVPHKANHRGQSCPIGLFVLPLRRKISCLFNNIIFCVFSFCFSQYFETDDQEFYKTKVCFILNNDVSEMDLVFAEEKYSKSGQLEKVRQRFGKEILFIFFLLLM